MKDIPEISFKKPENDNIELDVLTLQDLFSSEDSLEFQLNTPHRVHFYHILFITKGAGIHTIDFKQYGYNKGSILFISKGQVHAFDVKPDSNGFLILFTDNFLQKILDVTELLSFFRLFKYNMQLPIINLEETDERIFEGIIGGIYEERHHPDMYAKEEILRSFLTLLLLKAGRLKRSLILQDKNPGNFNLFSIFRKKLEERFFETRHAKDYAELLNISDYHLNKSCKTITGHTAKKYIDAFIILEIKRRLVTSNVSVNKITYQMGFDEPTNFIKFFKKHTRQTPSQFKKLK